MTDWIPCDPNAPNHRLPTEVDADEDGMVWCDYKSGIGTHAEWEWIAYHPDRANAWAPIPKSRPAEPYKPPVLPKAKRRERWAVFYENGCGVFCETEDLARDHAESCGDYYCLMVEARDGDPTPKAIQAVIEEMKSFIDSDYSYLDKSRVRVWAEKLGG